MRYVGNIRSDMSVNSASMTLVLKPGAALFPNNVVRLAATEEHYPNDMRYGFAVVERVEGPAVTFRQVLSYSVVGACAGDRVYVDEVAIETAELPPKGNVCVHGGIPGSCIKCPRSPHTMHFEEFARARSAADAHGCENQPLDQAIMSLGQRIAAGSRYHVTDHGERARLADIATRQDYDLKVEQDRVAELRHKLEDLRRFIGSKIRSEYDRLRAKERK